MQYYNFPKISPEAARILQILLDQGMVTGAALMRLSNLRTVDALAIPIRELYHRNLIEIGGDIDGAWLVFSTFGTLPSARKYLEIVAEINEEAKIQYV
jgi:hypothetical protein